MKTVNLELAKQLKEAGYPQVGLFMWDMDSKLRVGIGTAQAPHFKTAFPDVLEVEVDNCITAPTADEILDQLPSKIDEFVFKVLKGNTGSYCIVYSNDHDVKRHICWYPNLADACAKMWLYLKKEGLL